MNKPEKVAILGLGAMGAYFASRFLATPAVATTVIAKGVRYEHLLKNGIWVNGEQFSVPVSRPEEASGPVDLIIVALKHQNLPEATADLANFVGPETIILSVMNGLDSEKYLGEVYGMDKLLYAISVGIDAVREGGVVNYTNPGKLVFGEADNRHLSPRVEKLQQLLTRAGIPFDTPPDMLRTLWWKFMINVGMNQASALLGAPYGVFHKTQEARELMEALMREVIAIAEPAGINLGEQALIDWYPVLESLAPHGKTSMLQDIEAGRKTEVEIFGCKVLELGEKYHIPVPVNRTAVQVIKVLEQS